jgi:protein-S-isoprenylcysteine O-methyltransferase Ste14
VRRAFGAEYDRYAAEVPAWFPRLGSRAPVDRPTTG